MIAQATTPKLSRSEQARINGSLGRGPVTEQGKLRSSQNAFKHGVYSSKIILPGESSEEFFKLLGAYEEQFRPTDQLERDLIQDLADARWRIERMKRQETLDWSQATMEAAQDPRLAEAPYEVLHEYAHRERAQMKGNPLENLRRAEARYRRDFDRALKTLNQHRREKLRNEPKIEQPAPQPEPQPEPENVRNEPNEPETRNDLPSIFAKLPLHDPQFLQALRALHALRTKNQ
ncbi:MAG: hypothetical protein JST93_28640 [Acidobacteria bacterium]|nr:hypothetical protein [Acidobacteriota bacterium]